MNTLQPLNSLTIFSCLLFLSQDLSAQFTEPAPQLVLRRDDHVATLEMDYDPNSGWGGNMWNIGSDGTDALGYRIQWWPDPADIGLVNFEMGCASDNSAGTMTIATENDPYEMVSANKMVQIQPIANNVRYHVKVEKLNGFGQVCSPATTLDFMGGDGIRVNQLRTSMTFFDDFNLPMGPNNEKKWNNAQTPQTDPRFNLFFINGQCHTHSLNGTRNDGAGDKSQTAQRARKPILIEATTRRRIVFDMDGIFSGRSVWYLDFNPVNTDLTGHMSFFDFDGDEGLPADVCRLKATGHGISVNLIDAGGASYKVAEADLSQFGKAMMPNVRRSFDVRLAADGIQIFVDGVEVIDQAFAPGAFKPGIYHPLWSVIGYNTSKDDVPFFLSHWDNFGFDGPDLEAYHIHNYVIQTEGSDLQKTYREWNGNAMPANFEIHIPDDIRPLADGVKNDVYLVWTYLKNDYSSFNIQSIDSFTVNGRKFPMPQGGNNTNPNKPGLVDYSGSALSNRIKIDQVMKNGPSLIAPGMNQISFVGSNTGIVNVHLEVFCPASSPEPAYTPPSSIHHFVHHGDLPKTGPSARISFIDDREFSQEANDQFVLSGTLSDTVPVEVVIGNFAWSNWAPQWFNQPSLSTEYWTAGSTRGIERVELYLRKKGTTGKGLLVNTLQTNVDAPAPQLRYTFLMDTKKVPDGNYELFVQAITPDGTLSHPAYGGFGFRFDLAELSGAYTGIKVNINNGIVPSYRFNGLSGNNWTTTGSWENGLVPPQGYNGEIYIDADCIIPSGVGFSLGPTGSMVINASKTLRIME